MDHHPPAPRLPVEVQSIIFDTLDLQELLAAAHTSTFWRAVALRHPTYWRNITLSGVSASVLDLFRARLEAGGQRTFDLRVLDSDEAPNSKLRTEVVLSAIQHNLYRMGSLVLDMDMAYEEDFFTVLRKTPAPRLNMLDLAIVRRGNATSLASYGMPADMFACNAPCLRSVRLEHIMLHEDQLPVVFSKLVALRCCYKGPASFPTAILAQSKSLQVLDLFAEDLSLVWTGAGIDAASSLPLRSAELTVPGPSSISELVRHLPSASIPAMTISFVDKDSRRLLLAQLRRRLEARLHHTDKAFFLEYRSADTGMTRTFIAALLQIAHVYLPPVYLDGLTARIHALSASATTTGLIPAFGELPVCTRFTLTVADGEALSPPKHPLSLPELRHVDITSKNAARLTVRDLAAFLAAAVVPLTRAVTVTLQGVSLEGDFSEIPRERFVLSTLSVLL